MAINLTLLVKAGTVLDTWDCHWNFISGPHSPTNRLKIKVNGTEKFVAGDATFLVVRTHPPVAPPRLPLGDTPTNLKGFMISARGGDWSVYDDPGDGNKVVKAVLEGASLWSDDPQFTNLPDPSVVEICRVETPDAPEPPTGLT